MRTQHQTIPLGKEFLADFPSLVEKTVYVTDGALDPTGAADLYVQRRAREIAPVRVSDCMVAKFCARCWSSNDDVGPGRNFAGICAVGGRDRHDLRAGIAGAETFIHRFQTGGLVHLRPAGDRALAAHVCGHPISTMT